MKQDSIQIQLETKNISIPYAINPLKGVIDDSRYILNLDDDWDDAGAIAYDTNVWEKAIEIVIDMHLKAFKLFDIELDYPEINPGPDGSIDFEWVTDNYEILANFLTKENIIDFYGETVNGSSFKGSFGCDDNCSSLLMILIGMKKCGK
jgi:hypothetical protein